MLLELQRLLTITKQLRSPITGCEWDRVQTFESLKSYTLEETYEVLAAIDSQNSDELKEELGDLLFHIVFYADLADDKALFNFNDVCQSIADKLVSRHPHIFENPNQCKPNWEQLKQKERNQKAQYSILDDIPISIPALMRAEKIQKRCASVGFDWQTAEPVLAKVKEELDEVRQAISECINDAKLNQKEKIEEEIGDLFFATANLARHFKINPELCLQKANQKFEKRFKQVESLLKVKGLTPRDATLDEMEAAWQQIKQFEMLDK